MPGGTVAVAGEPASIARPLPKLTQERKAPDERLWHRLPEGLRQVPGRERWQLAGCHGERQPAAERGLARPRRARHVQRFSADTVKQRLLVRIVELATSGRIRRVFGLDGRERRDVDLTEAYVLAVAQVEAEQHDLLAVVAQPRDVALTNGLVGGALIDRPRTWLGRVFARAVLLPRRERLQHLFAEICR